MVFNSIKVVPPGFEADAGGIFLEKKGGGRDSSMGRICRFQKHPFLAVHA